VALSEELITGPPANRKEVLGKIADLLERQGINVEEVGQIGRVSIYQSLTKNDEGEAEIHDLMGIQFSPAWETGPQWPVINPGKPANIKMVLPKPITKPDGYETAVILPDIQFGYYRDSNGELVSTHDETALTIALNIVTTSNADKVILVGDNMDFPEFGKYRLSPAFALTTQASIDRATRFSAELRAAAPNADIVWLAGNHEERLPNYVLDNAKAAFGLRRGNTPDNWPVLSVPHLCRFDEYRIRYLAGYPASSYWINERIRVIHGDKVASGGSTAHKYLATSKTSVVFGHIHRREWAERSREDFDGPKTILAASPGTLAKTDGAVPSTKGGIDLDGRPLPIVEDWQQGLAVVTYQPGDGEFWYEQIPIHSGRAWWRGKLYV
jgi:predicted phosphodiesterase